MPHQNNTKTSEIPYSSHFRSGLLWNLFDSVGSQGLVILYHMAFRHYYGTVLHGIMGCLLSLLYLIIIIANLGLDYSLAPFYERYTHTKKSFRIFVAALIIPQAALLVGAALLIYGLYPTLSPLLGLSQKIAGHLTSSLMALLCLTFVIESMRKTIRYFLKIAFYTRFTAILEVAATAVSLGYIVGHHYLMGHLTLIHCWSILLALSALQFIILMAGLYLLYLTLPRGSDTDHFPLSQLTIRILKTRLFAWATQCMHQIYSGNFLVPMCALKFGLEQASIMKIITSISSWITIIGQKVFGITGNALLAHVKSRSLETQQHAWDYVTHLLNQSLTALLIFLLINGKKLLMMQTHTPGSIAWPLLYFMLIITFIESLFILYEKWYILEEQAGLYFIIQAASLWILYASASYFESALLVLLTIALIRIATLILLTLFSFYRWKIWPSFTLPFKTGVIALLISLATYAVL